MSAPDESDIRAFWAWFESVSSDLAEDFEKEELVAALDTRVAVSSNGSSDPERPSRTRW
jgi:hypothetical protein